jgi:hypothetical protein
MARFEVFIPGREQDIPNVTLTVEAQNWIGALRSGLKSIGEGQEAIANVMCDIKEDNSIHVTDVATQRVFRLRELVAAEPTVVDSPRPVSVPDAEDTLKSERPPELADFSAPPRTLIEFPIAAIASPPRAAPSAPSVPAPISVPPLVPAPVLPAPVLPAAAVMAPAPVTAVTPPAPAPVAAPPPAEPDPDTVRLEREDLPPQASERAPRPASGPITAPISPPTPRGVPAPAPKRPSGQFAAAPEPTSREVTDPKPTDPKIGREKAAPPLDVQDAIAAVFDATQDLYMETSLSAQKVADTLLDIALRHIPAEAGTFYLADVNGHELTFTAVRGPKADALKRSGMSVKVGQGIIGFCALEGVCLLVADIQKDPRFYSAIARTIDYQPRDTICASAEKDGRLFGAIQLINSRPGSLPGSGSGSKTGFDAAHMEVLRFIGLTAAAMLERIDERG